MRALSVINICYGLAKLSNLGYGDDGFGEGIATSVIDMDSHMPHHHHHHHHHGVLHHGAHLAHGMHHLHHGVHGVLHGHHHHHHSHGHHHGVSHGHHHHSHHHHRRLSEVETPDAEGIMTNTPRILQSMSFDSNNDWMRQLTSGQGWIADDINLLSSLVRRVIPPQPRYVINVNYNDVDNTQNLNQMLQNFQNKQQFYMPYGTMMPGAVSTPSPNMMMPSAPNMFTQPVPNQYQNNYYNPYGSPNTYQPYGGVGGYPNSNMPNQRLPPRPKVNKNPYLYATYNP